jgi:Zn-dependent protease
LETLGLFLIVIMHEFGHQLACRQVGGTTHDIVLWPLGGVAYVNPPQRPGAQLWSIAAGPLVNVILIPILAAMVSVSAHSGWPETHPDAYNLFNSIYIINFVLLVFNLLPVYPLDGGQILRSLLWFLFGRANSLMVASIIGFIGVIGLIGFALYAQSIWIGILAFFALINCWAGFKQAKMLSKVEKIIRRPGFACPSCHMQPPLGELWRCGQCRQPFDTFLTQGICPHCQAQFNLTQCLDCGQRSPMNEWQKPVS